MFLIAGPCAIENREMVLHVASEAKKICEKLGLKLFFKSSFDKANRTSLSPRGIGMEQGLQILQEVKDTYQLPILTDVHESWQCEPVAQVADVLQIPAFLCRQTDLLQAAAKTGKIVNVKKGQFLAPWDMAGAVQKIQQSSPHTTQSPAEYVWLTERGTTFGYGRLVVDMTALVELRKFGCPVVFDATHSVQQPGSGKGYTGGNSAMIPYLLRAAVAVGVDGIFLEVHPEPEKAISDAANQLQLDKLEGLLSEVLKIDKLVKNEP